MLVAECRLVLVTMFTVLMVFLASAGSDTVRFLPVFLGCGWKGLKMREECGHLPHILVCKRLVPGGHTGVANASADRVIDVPIRIIERGEKKLRRRRIHRALQCAGLVVHRAMADGTVHG